MKKILAILAAIGEFFMDGGRIMGIAEAGGNFNDFEEVKEAK